MFLVKTRTLFCRNVWVLKFNPFKLRFQRRTTCNLRPDTQSNLAYFRDSSEYTAENLLLFSRNHLRFQHCKVVAPIVDENERFINLLERIPDDISVKDISFIISEMTSILNHLALEDRHRKELVANDSLINLFKAIHRLVDEIPDDDILGILEFCWVLNIPLNQWLYLKMFRKLQKNFETSSFSAKCRVLFVLLSAVKHVKENPKEFWKLRDVLGEIILGEIRKTNYLNYSEDISAAFHFVCLWTSTPSNVKADVVNDFFSLKSWDDPYVFKMFFNSDLCKNQDLCNKFFRRLKNEVRDNNKHIHYFLMGYSHAVAKKKVDYDSSLVDEVVEKILENRPRILVLKILNEALSRLRHCNYNFVEYLVDFLGKNPTILKSHPHFSSVALDNISDSNCDNKVSGRWSSKLDWLRNDFNLEDMADFSRQNTTKHLYLLLRLASLEIFIDQELSYLAENYKTPKNFLNAQKKHKLFLLSLNSAVKIMHPNYSKPLLVNQRVLSLGIETFASPGGSNELIKKTESLKSIKNCLELKFNAENSVKINCINKSGLQFDGILAINDKKEFYDFGAELTEKQSIEDLILPPGYKMVVLLLVDEKEQARNTLDLSGLIALKKKIYEKSDFVTVVICESILKNLMDKEKGNYVYQEIFKKLPVVKNANDEIT